MENIEEQENQLDHGNDTSDNEDNFLNEEPDPFYDEAMDEKDELWVNKNLRKEALSGKKQSSGTLLSCPACFTTLCMDCQQHEKYQNQWRAMFVQNCAADVNDIYEVEDCQEGEIYHPVTCEICKTVVGVMDPEEVYYFFNVIPSNH
mmetsp:Transcript_24180/g.31577  ORF Transcript_24180/g.31577 Transcript_24180/m.31577 type:complete len:147 (+) Transcript_24180:52-492(+)